MISFEEQAEQAGKDDAICFGKTLRTIREGQEKTARELAEQVGITTTMLAQIEQGTRISDSFILLFNLSEALNVPLMEMIELRYPELQPKQDGRRDKYERAYKREALATIEKALMSASYSREELHIICEMISAYSSAKSTTP